MVVVFILSTILLKICVMLFKYCSACIGLEKVNSCREYQLSFLRRYVPRTYFIVYTNSGGLVINITGRISSTEIFRKGERKVKSKYQTPQVLRSKVKIECSFFSSSSRISKYFYEQRLK